MRGARWIAVFGLVSLFACGDDDRPEMDAGGDDSGLDASMLDSGTDAGSDAPMDDAAMDAEMDGGADAFVPPARLATLIDEAAAAVCAGLVRCCDETAMTQFFSPIVESETFESFRDRVPPAATLTEEQCGDVLAEIYAIRPFGDWVEAASAGEVDFVESELDACLTEIEEAECGAEMATRLFDGECLAFVAPNGGESQRRMFERTRTDGDACDPISDGLGAGFYGTCDPDVAFCCYRAPGEDDCAFPVAGAVGTCAEVADVGEPCAYGSIPLLLCATGLYCNDEGRCEAEATTPLDNGETCASPGFDILGNCTDGYCDLLGTRECTARKANGESCTGAEECAGGECSGTPRICRTSTFCAGEVVAVTVAVMPMEVTLETGATQTFTATVMGAADTSVTWSASAGTIDGGVFTAPDVAGPVTVTATSVADPSVSASATVTVTEASTGAWIVSTLAGDGTMGSTDGTGAAARFRTPTGLALDTDGSILVADQDNDAIRRVTSAGVVTTVFAGAPLAGPWDVAVASDGALWVSDRDNHSIWRIEGGTATRLAGSPTGGSGYMDGLGTAARFNRPRGIVFDADGSLLVADEGNHTLRRVTATGEVTSFVGNGSAGFDDAPIASARLYQPFGVLRAGDTIYVAGTDHCVRRIAGGNVSRVAGLCRNFSNTGTTNGAASDARFYGPRGMAIGAGGVLLVADNSNNLIRSITADLATVETFAGTLSAGGTPVSGFMDGDALSEARFFGPTDLVVLADGRVVIVDSSNHRVRVVAR